jgi:thiamine-phosphate pyrophosphorylase
MSLKLQPPITYLITSGETTAATRTSSKDFSRLLKLVETAVAARINLIQIREKNLTASVVYDLALRASAITRAGTTRLLINDRADIASAAGADGVHLTTRSLEAVVVRETFGPDFLIGVSTHSFAEARAARIGGADFAVFGPVFETASKQIYGAPVGLKMLSDVAKELAPFPVIALGGIDESKALECLRAGASGVAAIRLFSEAKDLGKIVERLGRY